jgi:uncharacterized low-complexity protein
MTLAWAAAAVIAAVAAMVSAGVSVVLLGRVQRMAERERALEAQLGLVDEAICAIEARLAGVAVAEDPAGEGQAGADAEREGMCGESIDAAIAPEIQAAIAAAAVVAAGERVRVHAVRQVKREAERNAWSQQGRVLVQTSHNMRAPR